MLQTTVALALLAVVLIAAVALWARSQRPGRRQAEASGPATIARVGTRAEHFPDSAARRDAFDPEATQVFQRPPPASAVPRKGAAPPLDAAGARLVGLSGSHKGRSYALGEAGITVGRHPSCDIVLGDSRVSGHHAWLGIVDGKPVLRDLKSTNGTFLNAQTHSSVQETELRAGDTIFFGGHQGDQFRFVAD